MTVGGTVAVTRCGINRRVHLQHTAVQVFVARGVVAGSPTVAGGTFAVVASGGDQLIRIVIGIRVDVVGCTDDIPAGVEGTVAVAANRLGRSIHGVGPGGVNSAGPFPIPGSRIVVTGRRTVIVALVIASRDETGIPVEVGRRGLQEAVPVIGRRIDGMTGRTALVGIESIVMRQEIRRGMQTGDRVSCVQTTCRMTAGAVSSS